MRENRFKFRGKQFEFEARCVCLTRDATRYACHRAHMTARTSVHKNMGLQGLD